MGIKDVAAVASAAQTRSAGKMANLESRVEADQIRTGAVQREADRKERLARAVSSQMAATGASGIGFGGSPLSVIEEDQSREQEATSRDKLMSDLAAQTARLRGKVKQKQANTSAALGLLQAGEEAAASATGGDYKWLNALKKK